MKYNVYRTDTNELLKSNCTLTGYIPAGKMLTDDEVRKYFNIDESNRYWRLNHKPFGVDRLVFDKIVIPKSPYYRVEECEEE